MIHADLGPLAGPDIKGRRPMRRAIAGRRAGFTLIEMLVVVFIIILLVGLLLPAVQKARDAATRAQCKSEIANVGTAIENFKSTYDVKYIPTFFVLSNDYNYLPGDPPALKWALNESREFYSKVWPKGFIPGFPGRTPLANDVYRIQLDGNQLLVFLLGGVPPASSPLPPTGLFPASFQGNRQGFSGSPTNPFGYNGATENSTAAANQAKGPFYDFSPKRVDTVFGHFHDPYWKTTNDPLSPDINLSVYYYFSFKFGNDYDYWGNYAAYFNPGNVVGGPTPAGGYGGMNPHAGLDNRYVEPGLYQIVSAGKDQTPDPGGQLTGGIPKFNGGYVWPGSGAYKQTPGGADDLANFSAYVLGSDK